MIFVSKMKIANFKNRAFTLVELLVTISIFSILTGVVLFSQTKFNGTVLLTNLAYDAALTIRQAQTYGVNIKEFDTGSTNIFVPYGVSFNLNNPNSFTLFADVDYTSSGPDKYFHPFNGDYTLCETDKGCVTKYSIKKGNFVKEVFYSDENGEKQLSSQAEKQIDIGFVRPNPDAEIIVGKDANFKMKSAKIILGSPDGSTREIVVNSTGLISVTPR